MFFILDKLLCMIICYILITKQLILCRQSKENLYTVKLAGAQKVDLSVSLEVFEIILCLL